MPAPHFLETLLDRPIAFHCVFAELTESVNAGILLSQAVYWSKRTKDPAGWFYKSQSEWQQETYLTREKQDSARARLRAQGTRRNLPAFWHEERRGLPARVYYRIDFDVLSQHLFALHQQYVENTQTGSSVQPDLTGTSSSGNVENPQTRLRKTHKLESGKHTNKDAHFPQTGTRKTHNPSLQRLQAETTSRRRRRARAPEAAATAAAKSKFAETLILDFLDDTKPHNKPRNSGLAHKLWLTGSDDHLIERWNRKRTAAAEAITQQQMQEVAAAIEQELETALWLLSKPELEDREKEWLPAIIANLSTRPDLAGTVAQLKGLL